MTKFYLNKADAKISGVCAGIADSTGLDVTIVRIATVLVTLLISGFPVIAYIAAAWIAQPRPYGY
jgi:phage shock protein C